MSASICHRCGSRVVCREFEEGKVTVITVSELLETAYWCANCSGLLCGSCSGLRPSTSETSLMVGTTAFCCVCKQAMEPAAERKMTHAMSPRLRMPPAKKGLFAKLFGAQSPKDGSVAYLFTVTQHPQPDGREAALAYLQSVKSICMQDAQLVSGDAKYAAVFDTDPVDRAQMVKWAAETFSMGFEELSTKYDLTFVRFETSSGNGQVLIARNRSEA